jgi:hypothetical protein
MTAPASATAAPTRNALCMPATNAAWLMSVITGQHRKKAWLAWHRDDVARIFASMYEPDGQRFKYIDMPAAF